MSEKEFELYLSLLSRFLRLKPGQRAEIADELRAHLEERYEDLVKSGQPREEAIRRALDEFGDAAELASHFTHLAQQRRRRMIMRVSMGTVAATAVVLFVIGLFRTPEPIANFPEQAQAQQDSPELDSELDVEFYDPGIDLPDEPGGIDLSQPITKSSQIEERLGIRLEEIDFVDIPLSDVLSYLSEQIKVDILVDTRSLEEEGLTTELTIDSLRIQYANITADTALRLILTPYDLTFQVRTEHIVVQTLLTAEEELEVAVYNCRDLLQTTEAAEVLQSKKKSQGLFSVVGEESQSAGIISNWPITIRAESADSDYENALAKQFESTPKGPTPNKSVALIHVITSSTSGPWFTEDGAGGTIEEFDGLLVIRQSQAVHREIEELLEMLRAANQETIRRNASVTY